MTKVQLTPEQRANMLRWILTLEGRGERQYEQARHTLRRSDEGFCCLGVACDLHDPKGWKRAYNQDFDYSYGDETMCLPGRVMKWLGLVDDHDPLVTGTIKSACTCILPDICATKRVEVGDTVRQNVSWWNDNQRCTFAEIAKMLRDEFDIHDEEKSQ